MHAAAGMLGRASWQGAPAALVLLHEVYEVIAAIYNRAEAVMLGTAGTQSTETPSDAPIAVSAKENPPIVSSAIPEKKEA
jgi:hypothetical protein